MIEAKKEEEAKEYIARAGKILKIRKAVPRKFGREERRVTQESGSERGNLSGGNSEIVKGGEISTSSNGSGAKAGTKKNPPKNPKKAKRLIIRKT